MTANLLLTGIGPDCLSLSLLSNKYEEHSVNDTYVMRKTHKTAQWTHVLFELNGVQVLYYNGAIWLSGTFRLLEYNAEGLPGVGMEDPTPLRSTWTLPKRCPWWTEALPRLLQGHPDLHAQNKTAVLVVGAVECRFQSIERPLLLRRSVSSCDPDKGRRRLDGEVSTRDAT